MGFDSQMRELILINTLIQYLIHNSVSCNSYVSASSHLSADIFNDTFFKIRDNFFFFIILPFNRDLPCISSFVTRICRNFFDGPS